MLLYRFAKMMEEHSRLEKNARYDRADYQKLMQMKQRLEEELIGLHEEDCTDWAAEATY